FTVEDREGLGTATEREQQNRENGLSHQRPTVNSVSDRLSIVRYAIYWILGVILSVPWSFASKAYRQFGQRPPEHCALRHLLDTGGDSKCTVVLTRWPRRI